MNNLDNFINSPLRNGWIVEPGLNYYVRKSIVFVGSIELANCSAKSKSKIFGYWRFLKKYEHRIPFIAEQVINPDLAKLYELRKWIKRDIGGIPQYASPLMAEIFQDNEYFKSCYIG